MHNLSDESTICALSTAPGIGGISIVRVSGKKALTCMKKLCSFLPDRPTSHKIYYGFIKTHEKFEDIDEVLVSYFAEGKSYTGEETLEISCHGSPLIAQQIINELLLLDVRLANKGEFTYRAFLNNNINLTQAESVLSLIQSNSQRMKRQSLRQLKGEYSSELLQIEDDLSWSLAHLEANIDFSTENIEYIGHDKIIDRIKQTKNKIEQYIKSYRAGKIFKEGFFINLVGAPNVGKSSIFNQLLKEEKAIVTALPGTTRDILEGSLEIDGVNVVILDTAGLRATHDPIEAIGIERTKKSLNEVDSVFVVWDLSRDIFREDLISLEECLKANSEVHFIFNKLDSTIWINKSFKDELIARTRDEFPLSYNFVKIYNFDYAVELSVFQKRTYEKLMHKLASLVQQQFIEGSNVVLHQRHFENFCKMEECLEQALKAIEQNLSFEFIAIELQEALLCIYSILGKTYDDQVMDRVFKEFCIGK